MTIDYYKLKVKPGFKLTDEELIRLAIRRTRKILAETDVDKSVIGFFHRYGITVYVSGHSNPEDILWLFNEAKEKVGKTCPKLHHHTVGP